ncbi:MAG TPA: response regulator, partial [Gammaproteobacteria bacterium]|nr:response regulator [Gammaproteobacteria bacterium]
MATLLLVTDEAIIRKSIQMGLEKQGHTILIAESLQAAKQVNTAIDCV